MDMIKVGTIGVLSILFALSLKSYKAEYGIYIALAVCLVILEYIMRYFMQILSGIEVLRGYLRDHYSYLSLLLKAVGATYACEFCAGICRDAGYGGVAGQMEMLGKVYILSMGMPVLLSLIESIQSIAG
ncbi:MAG: stage III sporulation protein AD [Bacteroidales bacterium]|nr:stage III sporulation protein AD [Bacteroidales bacterium]MCM1415481.1 stage III sporulation protein AD [bacterium]MCM1423418.1 stage III sporulation protein AD [bacterium]